MEISVPSLQHPATGPLN